MQLKDIKLIAGADNAGRNLYSILCSIILISLPLLVVGAAFSSPERSINNGSLSEVATRPLELMPLWGGAGALSNIQQQPVQSEDSILLHHFDEIACGNCHEAPLASGSSDTISWRSGVDVNRSCTSFGCHDYDKAMNHPIGSVVSQGISNQMQLGTLSEITCLTCHQSNAESHSNTTEERFLISPETAICQNCHSGISGSRKQRSHWKFSSKAHLVPLVPGSASPEKDDTMALGIDAESQSCLSCHDEISADISFFSASNDRKIRGDHNMRNHPIGMNYQMVQAENSLYYNSLPTNQTHLRMFDGKMGCGSCHSLYSQTRFHLSIENEKSALCRTCHNR